MLKSELQPLLDALLDSTIDDVLRRLPSVTVDAFAALLQSQAEDGGDCDFFLFSSWIAPIAEGRAAEHAKESIAGTIRSHVTAAVGRGVPEPACLAPYNGARRLTLRR